MGGNGIRRAPAEEVGAMIPRVERLSQVFAWLGHAYMHCLTGIFLTVVLVLETEWQRPYGELIGLWTAGAFLVGVLAPLAGWLGDRWSNAGMMAVFFIGSGGAIVAAALADGPAELWPALAALGAFAAIYHPVGMSWLVRTSANRGFALGVWGVFGSVGVASAGIVAGGLATMAGWRAAFWLPGAVSLATGLLLLAAMAAGRIDDGARDRVAAPEPARGDVIRAFVVLSLTVFLGGLIYNATQIALPKAFAERAGDLFGGGVMGAGALFTLIYLAASMLQIPAGWIADRYPLRFVYAGAFACQVPLAAIAAAMAGLPFVAATAAMVMANVTAIPAENCLMARYTPSRWRGSMFGAKFVLSLGVAPVAVQLVGLLHDATGDFATLFGVVAASAAAVAVAALLLPRERSAPAAAPLPQAAE